MEKLTEAFIVFLMACVAAAGLGLLIGLWRAVLA
jgi:hypothetical protein